MRLLKLSVALLLFYVVSGCVSRSAATISPDINITKTTSFYVIKSEHEPRGIDQLIRDKLILLGYAAKSGPEVPPANYNADIVVTYQDRWRWDITMYMIEFSLAFRHPGNGYLLAASKSHHTSLARKSPEEMVEEAITNILDKIESRGKQ